MAKDKLSNKELLQLKEINRIIVMIMDSIREEDKGHPVFIQHRVLLDSSKIEKESNKTFKGRLKIRDEGYGLLSINIIQKGNHN